MLLSLLCGYGFRRHGLIKLIRPRHDRGARVFPVIHNPTSEHASAMFEKWCVSDGGEDASAQCHQHGWLAAQVLQKGTFKSFATNSKEANT